MSKELKVKVTAADIRHGIGGRGFNCAIARALQRATKDREAHVMSQDWELRIFAWSLSVPAPQPVQHFVVNFDRLPRDKDGKPIPEKLAVSGLEPFEFTLPAIGPNWLENCYGCEELFATAELDDGGYCSDCHAKYKDGMLPTGETGNGA